MSLLNKKLVAIDPCIMEYDNRSTLTVGKSYKVIYEGSDVLNSYVIAVTDDEGDYHTFDLPQIQTYFKLP